MTTECCLLRHPGPPTLVEGINGVQLDDARLAAVLSPDARLLCLYDQATHGEGTVWDTAKHRLIWSDVKARRVMAWYPDGRVEVVIDATPFINGNAFDGEGRLLHCEHGRRCISRTDPDGITRPLVTHYEGKRLNTPNDLVVARDGAIWFTDPVFGLRMPQQGWLRQPDLDHRSVYRFDPTTQALRRMADFVEPNGLAFSPDERTLYVSDTSRGFSGKTHEIQAFDVDPDGSLTNRRFFLQTDIGVPDGFKVDRRGWVWTTSGNGIHIYDETAKKLGFVPTPQVCSNCAFGGADGRRLFIAAERYLLAIDLLQP
jgi:gluconolactonase